MNANTLAPKLTRLAALADATVEKMFAISEHENLSTDNPIEFGLQLGLLLQAEIAELRRQVAIEETARLVRRVAE